jgi:thymidine kinase
MSIKLILGPMFSQKSTTLFHDLTRYELAGQKTLLIKFAQDTRYDETQAATHDLVKRKAIAVTKLSQVDQKLYEGVSVVGIDEGQIFDELPEYVEWLANKLKLVVIIAALDGTSERVPFKRILEVIPLAEFVVKLHAVCMQCKDKLTDASFTTRLDRENKSVIAIGGKDAYQSTCRKCWLHYKEHGYFLTANQSEVKILEAPWKLLVDNRKLFKAPTTSEYEYTTIMQSWNNCMPVASIDSS